MLRAMNTCFLRSNKRTRRKRLCVESLESRRLLAGDVAAEVIDGDLILRGDQLSNLIEVRAATDGTAAIQLIGLAGEDGDLTTINGAPSLLVDGVTGDVDAVMRAGDDVIYFHDIDLPGGMKIVTGSGNDAVLVGGLPRGDVLPEPLPIDGVDITFDGSVDGDIVEPVPVSSGEPLPIDPVPILPHANTTVAGTIQVRTGAGEDAVAMGSVEVFGNLNLNTGRGGDRLTLGLNELPTPTDELPIAVVGDGPAISLPLDVFGALRINTGGGDDSAWLESVHVAQNMRVTLGGGSDVLSYDWGSVAGRIVVDAGAGDDIVALAHVIADAIVIRARSGDDGVGLAGVAARRLNVHLGAGNDQMLVVDTVAHRARFHGGGGVDSIGFDGENNFQRLTLLSFEIIS